MNTHTGLKPCGTLYWSSRTFKIEKRNTCERVRACWWGFENVFTEKTLCMRMMSTCGTLVGGLLSASWMAGAREARDSRRSALVLIRVTTHYVLVNPYERKVVCRTNFNLCAKSIFPVSLPFAITHSLGGGAHGIRLDKYISPLPGEVAHPCLHGTIFIIIAENYRIRGSLYLTICGTVQFSSKNVSVYNELIFIMYNKAILYSMELRVKTFNQHQL